MLPGVMKTKASHDGLFCELYWGTTRNEAWNFGPERAQVRAAPDETVDLPLYGFTLPEEPFLLAERTVTGYRVFLPPAARAEKSQRGEAFRPVSETKWVDLTPEDRLRLTQGELSLLLTASVAGKRAGGLGAKDLGLLAMLLALLSSIPVGLLLAGHSPERMAEANARALAAAKQKELAERKRLGVDTPPHPRAPEPASDGGVRTLPGSFGTR